MKDRFNKRSLIRWKVYIDRSKMYVGYIQFMDFPGFTRHFLAWKNSLLQNALMVKVHESSMRILSGTDSLTTYRFHTNNAEHYLCKVCGVYPFHRKRVTPDYFGVNVFCLEGFDPKGISVRAAVGAGMK